MEIFVDGHMDFETAKKVIEIYHRLQGIENILNTMPEIDNYSCRMTIAHNILQLPSDNEEPFKALEMIWDHYHENLEHLGGENNGKKN